MSELDIYLQELQKNIEESDREINIYEQEMSSYKNEKLNNEGISTDAHVLISINKIELQSDIRTNKPEVKVILDSFNKTFKPSSQERTDFIYNEDLKM